MLRPALPRFASAGDLFDVRVVVQTVGSNAGQIAVGVEASGAIELTAAEARARLRRIRRLVPFRFSDSINQK